MDLYRLKSYNKITIWAGKQKTALAGTAIKKAGRAKKCIAGEVAERARGKNIPLGMAVGGDIRN